MARLLQVRPQDLRNDADKLIKFKEKDMDTMTDIRALIMSLSQIWQGKAQTEYTTKFLSMQPVFNNFYAMLDQFAEVERAAADEAEKVDNDILSQIHKI